MIRKQRNVVRNDAAEEQSFAVARVALKDIAVKTEAYKNWLESRQKINPFIGKHGEIDHESEVADEILSQTVVDESEYASLEASVNGEDALVEIGEEGEFIEFVLVENVVKQNLQLSNEEIESRINTQLNESLGVDYIRKTDIPSLISEIKQQLFLESDKQ